MNRCFADTFYFLALLNHLDAAHRRAASFSDSYDGQMVTTQWVLTEVADGLADARFRSHAISLINEILDDARILVIPASDESFSRAWKLYQNRPDKNWSLTDCISFEVMRHHNLTDALTADHHFAQAGFTTLLK